MSDEHQPNQSAQATESDQVTEPAAEPQSERWTRCKALVDALHRSFAGLGFAAHEDPQWLSRVLGVENRAVAGTQLNLPHPIILICAEVEGADGAVKWIAHAATTPKPNKGEQFTFFTESQSDQSPAHAVLSLLAAGLHFVRSHTVRSGPVAKSAPRSLARHRPN